MFHILLCYNIIIVHTILLRIFISVASNTKKLPQINEHKQTNIAVKGRSGVL